MYLRSFPILYLSSYEANNCEYLLKTGKGWLTQMEWIRFPYDLVAISLFLGL